eukprot:251152-Chlamydomonas_euryale.AAC.13
MAEEINQRTGRCHKGHTIAHGPEPPHINTTLLTGTSEPGAELHGGRLLMPDSPSCTHCRPCSGHASACAGMPALWAHPWPSRPSPFPRQQAMTIPLPVPVLSLAHTICRQQAMTLPLPALVLSPAHTICRCPLPVPTSSSLPPPPRWVA